MNERYLRIEFGDKPSIKIPLPSTFEELVERVEYSFKINVWDFSLMFYSPDQVMYRVSNDKTYQEALNDNPEPIVTLFVTPKTPMLQRPINHSLTLMGLPRDIGKAVMYHGLTNSFTVINNPKLIGSARICILNESKYLMTGGKHYPRQAIEIAVPNFEIKELPDITIGRSWHASIVWNGKPVILGGRDDNRHVLCSAEMFDSHAWVEFPPITIERDSPAATTYGESIFVCGGGRSRKGVYVLLNTFDHFSNGEWNLLPITLPFALTTCGLVAMSATSLMVIGGFNAEGLEVRDVMSVELVSGSVVQMTSLPHSDTFPSNVSVTIGSKVIAMGSTAVYSYLMAEERWETVPMPASAM